MPTCFMIQPFDQAKFDRRYKDIFKPAIERAGFEADRVDEDPSVTVVIDRIEKGINDSSVCLAEITTDNANVWFELGYALARKKPVVMICEKHVRTKFPFDVQHRNILEYDTGSRSDYEELGTKIVDRLKAIDKTQAVVEQLQPQSAIVLTVVAASRAGSFPQVTEFTAQKGTVRYDLLYPLLSIMAQIKRYLDKQAEKRLKN